MPRGRGCDYDFAGPIRNVDGRSENPAWDLNPDYSVGLVALGLFFETKGESRKSWAGAFADADRREKENSL